MAGFSSATLERIRAASDIVDVIGSYLPLKKAGANFVALCPFHKEKTPSFSVNPHRQIFHCFGCHKGGDVFTFVKEYENIGFVDAVRRLADRAKIPIEFDQSPGEQQSRHLKDQLLQIHEQIAQRWQNCLLNEAAGQTARDYLAKRGVSPEAVKLFRLGAAPDAWDDTVNWAKSKGHELALVEKAGLIIPRSETPNPRPQTPDARPETRNYYDRFRGRLMFPICDEQGRVIGFSGRVLSGDEKTAKYVNSPETPIFTKSKVFFGLDKSKRALLDAGFAVVCEGQLDLIACFMAGVQNVVAPQGTAFTDQHARILKRYVERIVLCFDSDTAGQSAAVRSLDTLLTSGPKLIVQKRDKNPTAVGRITQKIIGDALPSGLAISVAIMPEPHDPDSFIKEFGVEAFQRLINGAREFFDYFLDRLCATNDATSDLGRRTILKEMGEAVLKTGNAVLIEKYAQKTALRLGVSEQAVLIEFKKIPTAKNAPDENEAEPAAESETPRPSDKEFWLLKILLLHDDLVGWAALHLDINWILHPLARKIIEQRLAAQAKETWKSLAAFLDECETPEMRSLVTEAAAEDRKIPNPEQQLADVALRLRNQFLDRQIAALTHKISQPEISHMEQNELLHERERLREQKRAPLK
ncbi:MAG: DNA primase [Verrucomicrobiota bacterium]